MNDLYQIAPRLRELRKLTNLTQEEFSEYAGMNYKFYQQLEAGRRKLFRIDTVQRICRAYGIELWEFFHPDIPQISLHVPKEINSSPHNRRLGKKAHLRID